MAKTTSLTAWAEIGASLLRLTLYTDGTFRTLRGFQPAFDPFAVRWITDARLGNLAAHSGIRISGDSASARRVFDAIEASSQPWSKVYSLDEILGHEFLGKTADADTIRAAYAAQ